MKIGRWWFWDKDDDEVYAARQRLCLAIIEFTHNTTSHPHDHQQNEHGDRENIEKGLLEQKNKLSIKIKV